MNRYTWRTGLLEVLMIVAALIFVSPLYILVNLALKPGAANTSTALVPVTEPTLDNFVQAWNDADLGSALMTSSIITVVSLIIIVTASSLAGFFIARSTSAWSRGANVAFLLGLLIPMQLGTIPLYQVMSALGLLGTMWGLIIFYSAVLMPLAVFLYAAFIRALPVEYEEAAQVDGAGATRSFFSVVFPLLRPVTGTVLILNAINIWNDFFTPQLYLTGSDTQTVTVALFSYVGQYTTQWSLIFGGLIIASAPLLILFFILQRTVIQGFAGGLKG